MWSEIYLDNLPHLLKTLPFGIFGEAELANYYVCDYHGWTDYAIYSGIQVQSRIIIQFYLWPVKSVKKPRFRFRVIIVPLNPPFSAESINVSIHTLLEVEESSDKNPVPHSEL